MKIKWGALVVDGRGKIGGQVASKNRSGSYMRNKVTPVNPATLAQTVVRSQLAALATGWRALTAAQRASWIGAVEGFSKTDIFGDIKNPSGFNLYCRINMNLNLVNTATLSTAPAPTDVPVEYLALATVDVGVGDDISLTLTDQVPVGVKMVVSATPSLSAGINFVKSEFRKIEVIDAETATPVDVKTTYEARFGTPTVGSKVFFEVKFVNTTTGQASPSQTVSAIVVSTT